jgi:hypothetical protein
MTHLVPVGRSKGNRLDGVAPARSLQIVRASDGNPTKGSAHRQARMFPPPGLARQVGIDHLRSGLPGCPGWFLQPIHSFSDDLAALPTRQNGAPGGRVMPSSMRPA